MFALFNRANEKKVGTRKEAYLEHNTRSIYNQLISQKSSISILLF